MQGETSLLPSVHEEPETRGSPGPRGQQVSNTESEDPSNHRQEAKEHRIEPTSPASSISGKSCRPAPEGHSSKTAHTEPRKELQA